MRTAYQPLPLVFSRSLQQLVNSMLRADPCDRPATHELLHMPLVRKHLQYLMGVGFPKGGDVEMKGAECLP